MKNPELKLAKKKYSDLKKNPIMYKESRDEIISALIASKIPNWGNISVTLIKRP
jgi:hypothetical protein